MTGMYGPFLWPRCALGVVYGVLVPPGRFPMSPVTFTVHMQQRRSHALAACTRIYWLRSIRYDSDVPDWLDLSRWTTGDRLLASETALCVTAARLAESTYL